ncbi:GntR family transcriptional regulator [Rhizobium leguminosarum]|uniref:GntR family transcriptional regulator n=1 Tax=Rhizobium leguminosarum TaxID=384 RepID=UPI00143FA184|nr:GntR family transcriptional regulator [Rhizobium leguminosarum]NKL21228.1 FCD domain-containing protein [Rhizobium leguminosarum bv. viciae]NKL56735.1 FCD domain-containing protein [Rhizobium leguminosarum bv. viciae]
MDDVGALQVERQSASLRVQVEDRLRQAIAEGRFKPGDRLIERELCALIGVGRTSVREALRQLEAEGLVTSHAHRGPVVTVISYEEAKQLYSVRAILESFAGQSFAERGSGDQIAALDNAVKEFETAAGDGAGQRLTAAKNAFYDCLMSGCGNVFARQMLTTLHNRINLLRMTSMNQPGRLKHSVSEINDIAAAIRDRDGPRAAAACKLHIEMAASVALDYLRQRGGSPE